MRYCGKSPDAVAQIRGGVEACGYLDVFSIIRRMDVC